MRYVPAMPWSSSRRRKVAAVRGAGWPDNAEKRSIFVFGPNPIAVATVAAIDVAAGNALRGASGAVRIGNDFAAHGYFQTRRTLPPVGNSLNLRTSPRTALPNTSVPANLGGPAMALLGQLGPATP